MEIPSKIPPKAEVLVLEQLITASKDGCVAPMNSISCRCSNWLIGDGLS